MDKTEFWTLKKKKKRFISVDMSKISLGGRTFSQKAHWNNKINSTLKRQNEV